MTAATSLSSPGVPDSAWIMEAILRTSYAVRFLLRAYRMLTFRHSVRNSESCSLTRYFDVDLRSKLYVFGKRKPSICSFFDPKPGIVCGKLAERYVRARSLTGWWLSLSAFLAM